MGKAPLSIDRIASVITPLVICASAISLSAEDAEIVVFKGGTLIDGNGGAPVDHAAAVIQGDRILFAGREDKIEIPSIATVQALEGLTILPGFFNTHVHEASFTAGVPGRLELSRLAAWAQGKWKSIAD